MAKIPRIPKRNQRNTKSILRQTNLPRFAQGYWGSTMRFNEVPSEGWTPSEITTTAWYDASDASTITESGGAVSQWDDKSGNGNHLKQAAGANQPTTDSLTLNGLNVIDFDGTQYMYTDSAFFSHQSGWHALFVLTEDVLADTSPHQFFASTDGTGTGRSILYDRDAKYASFIDGNLTEFDLAAPSLNPVLVGISVNAGTGLQDVMAYLNGEASTTLSLDAESNMSADIFVGSSKTGSIPLEGYIAEFIIIPSTVVGDRQKLEGYLAHKWGLTDNLPVGHPYKSAEPTL